MMSGNTISFLLCISLLIAACGKDNKKWDSDFIVHNSLNDNIQVFSSAYTTSEINGQDLISFTDVVNSGNKFILRNIDAKEDPDMTDIFHELAISLNGFESAVNALDNSRWTKTKVSDDKFQYILKVDTTYFP